MESVIKISGLSKTFGQVKALKKIDLEIGSGEMVALLGPSGSGKSTLLRNVCGLTTSDANGGTVEIYGNTVQSNGKLDSTVRKTRARMAVIFQQFNLVNRMSVLGNVLLGSLGRIPRWRGNIGYFTRDEKRQAMAALQRVGMDHFASQRASTLSGGQQQRVAIAKALMQQAEVIFADEPIASLDPKSAKNVMEILQSINAEDGRTVIVTLHQVEYARDYCKRVVALNQGEMFMDDAVEMLTDERITEIYGTTELADDDSKPTPGMDRSTLQLASAGA
ncbi:MAG: phosphonate ABC transporter ATP-binding protein [Gammaproteobacteria bacterium]